VRVEEWILACTTPHIFLSCQILLSVCVCVCVRERERERESHRQSHVSGSVFVLSDFTVCVCVQMDTA